MDLSAPVSVTVPNALIGITKTDPELIQYAMKVFGTTDLSESQWKQCEDQIKVKWPTESDNLVSFIVL